MQDDDLSRFETEGAAPLPVTHDQGYVDTEGARIWYANQVPPPQSGWFDEGPQRGPATRGKGLKAL
jgi:hypothetical protein